MIKLLYGTLAYTQRPYFYLHRFRLQVLLNMDTQSTSQACAGTGSRRRSDTAEKPRETELNVLQRLQNKGARKRRERGHVMQLLVKDKLPYTERYANFVEDLDCYHKLGLLKKLVC